MLREILEAKKMWKWMHHREMRIAAAQALAKIDPRYGSQILSDSGLEPGNWRSPPSMRLLPARGCGSAATNASCCSKTLSATISSSWGKSSITIREMSLGGGMGTKEDNLRIGSEANLEISMGVRPRSARRCCCAARG